MSNQWEYSKDPAKKSQTTRSKAITGVDVAAGGYAGSKLGSAYHIARRGADRPGALKLLAGTKTGKIGAGVIGASLAAETLNSSKSKKAGVLVKKNLDDPFGISKAALNAGAVKPPPAKIVRGLRLKLHNATSKKASKAHVTSTGVVGDTGLKFGAGKQKINWNDKHATTKIVAGAYGGAALGVGGAVAGLEHSKTGKQAKVNRDAIMANSRKIGANTRKINQAQVSKAKAATAHLITDLGTNAVKPMRNSRLPHATALGATAYTGGVVGFLGHQENKKVNAAAPKRLKLQEAKLASQKEKLSKSDPFQINKASREAKNSAITGAGATTAGLGLVAGGVPGVKANTSGLKPKTSEEKKVAQSKTRIRRVAGYAKPSNVKTGAQAGRGGILAFRIKNHEGGTYGFKQQATMGEWYPSDKPHEAYKQGLPHGRVAPEEKVIAHMKGGKKAAGVALGVGAAAAAYGSRDKIKAKFGKSEKSDKRNGAALGAGATGAALTTGTGALLGNQEKKWRKLQHTNEKAAGDLVPGLKGVPANRAGDFHVTRNKQMFDGVDLGVARKAGHLRGAARQGEHFAHVYGTTGKVVRGLRVPAAGVAAAGAYGLSQSDKKKKTTVAKMGDAELRRRKMAQAHTSQATGTLGLAALGATLATTKTGRRVLPLVVNGKGVRRLKSATTPLLTASAGIGGVGAFNSASISSAESKRRRVPAPVAVQKNLSAFGVATD